MRFAVVRPTRRSGAPTRASRQGRWLVLSHWDVGAGGIPERRPRSGSLPTRPPRSTGRGPHRRPSPPGSREAVVAVRFSVDGALLGTVTTGPPYAVEWTDDNPFQRREIIVEAEDTEGDIGRDTVVLEPFVVTELAEITSVLVEAGVYDKQGRMARGLTADEFILEEDGTPQLPDMVARRRFPRTSRCSWTAARACRATSTSCERRPAASPRILRPKDRVLVAPFSRKASRAVTGPTNDRATIAEAVRPSCARRHGDAGRDDRQSRPVRGAAGRRVIVLITDGYDEHSRSSTRTRPSPP